MFCFLKARTTLQIKPQYQKKEPGAEAWYTINNIPILLLDSQQPLNYIKLDYKELMTMECVQIEHICGWWSFT